MLLDPVRRRRHQGATTSVCLVGILLTAACSANDTPGTAAPVTKTPTVTSSAAAATTAPVSTSPAESASTSASPPAAPAVEPIAGCVDEQQQAAEGVTLKRTDGIEVPALVSGTGKRGIVLANMNDSDLCEWLVYGAELKAKGYTVAVFNYSGSGGDDDMVAAATLLRERGASSVVLMGSSMGGTSALAAAAKLAPAPDAVVSLSGPGRFQGIDALEAAKTLTMPVFLAVGEYDTEYFDSATELNKVLKSKVKVLEVLPTGNHGTALLGDTALTDTLDAFLDKHGK